MGVVIVVFRPRDFVDAGVVLNVNSTSNIIQLLQSGGNGKLWNAIKTPHAPHGCHHREGTAGAVRISM